MARWLALLILAGSLVSRAQAADPPVGQWIAVTAPAFRAALEPLIQQRQAEGHKVVVVQTTDLLTPQEIRTGEVGKLRDHLRRLCRNHAGPSWILLVGAVEADKLPEPEKRFLPPLVGTAGRMKGQPSDNGYGCLDDTRLPTVAVGRFPARNAEEARRMVGKTLEYERDRQPGLWRRRLTVLAGVPALNPVLDRLVESLALARFDRLDPTWAGQAIYHNPQSRFCVPDGQLHDRALQYVQAGQAFTVYFGHSGPEGFYAGNARYLGRDDWAQLKIGRGKGVFCTFGCLGCQLRAAGGEGYGLAAMRNPDGPVAVVGSHGICFAAMVQLAADGLFESAFAKKLPARLDAAWLALLAGLERGKMDALTYWTLDAADGDPKIPQATQRQEHLEMFVLLGDPALRLPAIASDLEIESPRMVAAGDTLTIQGRLPARLRGAKVQLSVERPVSSQPLDLEPLPEIQRDKVMLANHDRANRFVLAEAICTAEGERFQARLELPGKLPWKRLALRVYVSTEREEALKVAALMVRP